MDGEQRAFEQRLQAHGEDLLQRALAAAGTRSAAQKWTQALLERLNADEAFRVQALRFIDVLPSLDDDGELVRIFNEYFAEREFPLPRFGGFALQAGRLLGDSALAAAIRYAARLLSQQFMAGDDAAAVVEQMRGLAARGRRVSLDRVGEVTLSEADAERYLQAYIDLVRLAPRDPDNPLHLSLKLSSLYPRMAAYNLDAACDAVYRRLRVLSREALRAGVDITLDMEDYDRHPLVMAVFETWIADPQFAGWNGRGIALQAYLRDAEDAVQRLIALAASSRVAFQVRLVRGAYWDQECIVALQHGWPIPVWLSKGDTDRCFEACIDRLLGASPTIRTAVATHNPRSLAYAMARAGQCGLSAAQIEFQMLFGMAGELQDAIVDAGYPLRVYLPFGEPVPGMAYLVRRLLENASSQSLARRLDVRPENLHQLLQAEPADHAAAALPPELGFDNQPLHRFVDERERNAFAQAIAAVRGQLGGQYHGLVDGRAVAGRTSQRSLCPADPDLVVGEVTLCDRADAARAVAVATTAWPAWRETRVAQRAGLLRKAADALCAARDEFAAWQVFEAGKNWPEADADVCEAIDFLRYYADEAERLAVAQRVEVPGEHNRSAYAPRGVGVVIPPWNFPLAILAGMLSATLVSGNCAILKPSSDTPVVAARFVRLLLDAGLPPAVLGFLPGPGDDVGEFLVDHPAVHLVAFTGSREVGCRLLERAAVVHPGQTHVKRVIVEMGGKNAVIVDASADPDEAVAGIVQSAFGYQGQKCSACSRVIAVGGGYSRLLDRLVEAVDSLVMDLPWHPRCDLGPVINAAAQHRIETVIASSGASARLVYRGQRPPALPGYFVPPAVFADVDPTSRLGQDEIFGPVLALIPSSTFDQALAIANDTAYALTGGVYSRSPANLQRAAEHFDVGNLYLNRGITGALVARQPFGGFRLSGIGSKAGGPDYLRQFMEPRCVTENTLRRGVAPWRDGG